MVKESLITATAYCYFGGIYGLCRSFYYIPKIKDETRTIKGYVEHPLTFGSKVGMTTFQSFSGIGCWPIFVMNDIGFHQKIKMGIKPYYAPFPFDSYIWKGK